MFARLLKNHKKIALATLVSALSYSQAHAQAQPEALEEVRVWGTAVFASSVDLDQEAIAITQADHISDLLRSIPGVDVGGAHSLNQRITIRGMDDKDLQILIDGARQNTYMYHHMGNLQIHADILQSVDIEVGTNSVIDGGLGGSARFKTKSAGQLLRDDQDHGAHVQVVGSTNASDNIGLTGYGKLGENLDYLVYFNGIDRQNYEVGGGRILNSEGVEVGNTDGEVRGLEGDLRDALFKFGWNFRDTQRIKLGYETYEDEGNYSYRPDMGLATDLAISGNLELPLTYPTEFTRDTLTLNYEGDWGADQRIQAALFQNQSTLWRDESAINAIWETDPAYVEGKAENRGFNILAESALGDSHVFSYGFDYIDYSTAYLAEGGSDGPRSSSEDSENLALFIQDRVQLGNFALIPGLRYSSFDVNSTVVSDSYSKVTGALAGEWEITESLLVKLSTTQLFKAPDLSEVFLGAGLGEAPNPDLQAEEGNNNEFSLIYQNPILGADNFATGFTVFQTTVENHIYEYAVSPDTVEGYYWYDNIGDLDIEGYEFYIDYNLGGWDALFTVSDSEAVLTANVDNAALDGAHDSREQGTTTTFNLEYDFEQVGLKLHWDVQHVGGVPHYEVALDAATLENSKEAFTVHNISARWQPEEDRGLSITVGVDNLFDEFYASHSSRTGTSVHPRFGELYLLDYEPGRNIKATLAYRF